MGERLRLLAVQLAGIAGLLHVGLGLREWMLYARGGIVVPPDVRVPLWTFSGMAILFGIVVTTYRPRLRRPLHAAGVVVLVGYALAYYSWHLTGHRSLLFVGGTYLHDAGLLEAIVDHTFAGPVEFVALVTELGGAAALLALLRDQGQERAQQQGDRRSDECVDSIMGVGSEEAAALREANIETLDDVQETTEEVIADIDGISEPLAAHIRESAEDQ